MGLAVAIQMDPIDTINIDADSTFALALEAQARGHAMHHYLPQALTLRDGRLYARCRPLQVFRRHGNHHQFGAAEELDLAGFDIVLMRQDPPFDMAYITATHLLELLPENGPLVVNDPAAGRAPPAAAPASRPRNARATARARPAPLRSCKPSIAPTAWRCRRPACRSLHCGRMMAGSTIPPTGNTTAAWHCPIRRVTRRCGGATGSTTSSS